MGRRVRGSRVCGLGRGLGGAGRGVAGGSGALDAPAATSPSPAVSSPATPAPTFSNDSRARDTSRTRERESR